MSDFKILNEKIFNDTFNECYSNLLKNPESIDVKHHYAKIIMTYMLNVMREYPQFIRAWFNNDEWKWNDKLDSGRYYCAKEIDHAFSIISVLTNAEGLEFLQSIDFKNYDKENKVKWNGYHRVINENRELKQTIKELKESE